MTGVVDAVVMPSPSPARFGFWPQHHTVPFESSAQASWYWAETATAPLRSDTLTGDVVDVFVPFPSWPDVLSPQHLTPPETTAHMNPLPALIAETLARPGTVTGDSELPAGLAPQHITVPSFIRAHSYWPLPVNCVTVRQLLCTHDSVQVRPHWPQFRRSFARLTHEGPHSVVPPLHTQVPHAQLLLQVWVPPPQEVVAPGLHAPPPEHADQAPRLPSALQVRVCVPVLQLPQACVRGPLHVQTPALQVDPLTQAWPHVPQLAGSVIRFGAPMQGDQTTVPFGLHTPVCVPAQAPHDRGGGGVHAQTPAWQATPDAQARPQAPQLAGSDRTSRHTPPQSMAPAPLQVHAPFWQVEPWGQAAPHFPQLDELVCRSTQAPAAHAVNPLEHWQADHWQLELQTSVPLLQPVVVPAAHMPCPPQSDQPDHEPFTHVRLLVPHFSHDWVAAPLQTQTPLVHVEPSGHA